LRQTFLPTTTSGTLDYSLLPRRKHAFGLSISSVTFFSSCDLTQPAPIIYGSPSCLRRELACLTRPAWHNRAGGTGPD
jgi:hypothetical protein